MENLFNLLYSWVTQSNVWNDGYFFHYNYFITEGAFFKAFIIASVTGIVVAAIYYFGFCNGKTNKYANLAYWCIAMIIACVCSFALSSFVIIGSDNTNAEGESNATGFYSSLSTFCQNKVDENEESPEQQNQYQDVYNNIVVNLNQGEDVALGLNMTNLFIALVSFIIFSFIFKNFTKHGSATPIKKISRILK